MAPLMPPAASVRAEARSLRAAASELSWVARRQQRRSREAAAASASTCARAREQRLTGLPSPWSSLTWLPPDEELERVLVPVE